MLSFLFGKKKEEPSAAVAAPPAATASAATTASGRGSSNQVRQQQQLIRTNQELQKMQKRYDETDRQVNQILEQQAAAKLAGDKAKFISLANKRKLKETLRAQQYSAMAQVELSKARLEQVIDLGGMKESMTATNDAIGDTDALVDEFEEAKAASLAHGANIDSAFAGIAVDQEDATDEWENGPQVLMPDGTTHNPVKAAAATITAGSATAAAAAAAGGASSLSYPSSYPAVAPYAVGTAPVALPARARSPARAPAVPAEDSAEAEWNA